MSNHLRDMRKAANLTQAQVATELGIHFSLLSRWETGKRKPAPKHIATLARLYGVAEGDITRPEKTEAAS